jgi:tetratricopeptide (TPR) repeat protein
MKRALLSIRILVPVVLLLLFANATIGQQTSGKEAFGIDYFQNGNYEKALPIFAKLAQSYPDNPMYNYYYGVSLIKNNLFETAAKEALLNSVVDKTPSNANFYLANYFHALEEWQEAKDFYDRYEKIGSKQEKKTLRFDYYVNLCDQKINPFKPKKASDTTLFGDTLLKPPPKIDEKIFPIPDELKKAWFNFQVNEFMAYHSIEDFKSEASKILFTKAWMCTGQNDSLLTLTDSLRKEHDRIARVDTRLGIVQQIVDCEQKSYQLMRNREKFLEQSRVKESAFWEKEGTKAAQAYNAAIQERENKLNESRKKEDIPIVPNPVTEVKRDTVPAEIKKPDPKPAETTIKSIPTENLVYKVQIGSFKNGVMSPSLKQSYAKIGKLRKIDKQTDEKKAVTYTVGNFTQLADASKMKDQLIREGMKGAVVVTYDKSTGKVFKPQKNVPVAAKPQPVVVVKKDPEPVTVAKPTVPPVETAASGVPVENLVFKVQIGSFKNDLRSTVFRKSYARISKQMKVDKYTDSKNNVVYTVGSYPTYADASRMREQLIKEGLKDAYVAAFQNGIRIKVAEAIRLAGGK